MSDTETFKRQSGVTITLIQNIILLMSCALLLWVARNTISLREDFVVLRAEVAGQSINSRINSDRIAALEAMAVDVRVIKEGQARIERSLEKHTDTDKKP